MSDRTAQQRRVWNRAARDYDRGMDPVDRTIFRGVREWIGARAEGDVLEVAVGTGRNLPFYGAGARLTGLDLSPAMLALARARAADLGRSVELVEGDAERLPFPDASFDTVVCALGLCSIPDPARAVAEMARVLRPGGTLLLVDHVGSSWPPVWVLQWLLERVTIPLAGEYFTRRQVRAVEGAGLRIVERERRVAGAVERIRAEKPRMEP